MNSTVTLLTIFSNAQSQRKMKTLICVSNGGTASAKSKTSPSGERQGVSLSPRSFRQPRPVRADGCAGGMWRGMTERRRS